MDESKNLLFAVIISVVVLISWKMLVEDNLGHNNPHGTSGVKNTNLIEPSEELRGSQISYLDRDGAIRKTPRKYFYNEKVSGSINLQGARIDDLKLLNYKASLEQDSDNVILLSPQNSNDAYMMEIGWLKSDNESQIELPQSNTLWTEKNADHNDITLTWTSSQNVEFNIHYSLDDKYMFTIKQTIINNSDTQIELVPYARINRIKNTDERSNFISHEGITASLNRKLHEISYSDITKHRSHVFHSDVDKNGWFGFSDKYWFTAFIPNTHDFFTVKSSYRETNNKPTYQVDILETTKLLNQGDSVSSTKYFFAGAKELNIIDNYKKNLNIDLFDKSVDFGVLYFLTKPIFLTLKFFYSLVQNFGVSILILTILMKVLMIPVTNKSFISMAKMRLLQPELAKIKEKHSGNAMETQKASLKLFAQYNVKPMAGCLPILLQIPIFFALYKVLYITIDMRHAPFFSWIQDLSSPDPTNIFTLFNLIPWDCPDFLKIGILPIILGTTLLIQQHVGGTLSNIQDPVQANVMKAMPYCFVFIFATFPSGLIIYWILGNIISIAHQYFIKTRIINKFRIHHGL